ncbi:hypothetical protein Tco_0528435 [Tanacetum coccineum]
MMERKLGEGYSSIKKKCFVCGSLSYLIRDCDFYEKKMVREAELKKQRVFNTSNGVAKPVWNNANRVNHANHFVPRPVQLNTGRANVNSVRQNVNSVRSNVNTGSFNINNVKDKQPINTSNSNRFSPVRPQDHPLKNMEDRGIFDSGCLGHMTGNRDYLDDCEECKGGSITFGGSKGYITGKGIIRVGTSEVTNSAGTLQTPNANASEEEDEVEELIVVPTTVRQVGPRKSSTNSKAKEFFTELQNLKTQENEAYSTGISEDTPEILAFRRELDELALKHLNEVPKNKATSTTLVNSGSGPVNTQHADQDDADMNIMKDKSEVFKTPTQSKTSGEEDISPTTLEVAKPLSKVASQSTGFEDISTGFEEVNTGGLGVSTGSGPVSSARGQREGKAPMIVEETQAPKRTKEQIQQEEASLAEAIRLQTLEEEETAKQVHLDALLAKRLAEEEELTEQQKKRKAQVQFEAQFYTEEDWDAIRAKLEANAELTKDVLGKDLSEQDFAKRMVDLVNQRKKHFAEERAKAKRNKPMTQSQLRIYMSNYLKNQGTWKLSQLKKLKFEEIKEEFEKLVKQIDTFVPINIEATKAQLKRYGEELQTEISKKQRIDDKDVSDTEEKVGKVKEEEPVKRVGKRKKQKARKGISIDKSPQGDSETDKEESVEAMNPTPLDTKSNIVANWKIFQQGERSIYQIIRANGADTVYMSFGAMLKDFTREDLIELYRLVMQKYGTNRPEDAYDRVLWSDLRTMFDPPLNEDAIWSLPLQQKMISWRYYDKCAVHCLTLEACNIYMLADRKYPLSKDACQVMLKMKLLDGKMNEVCYKLLKMIEKQAGVKK